MSTDNEVEMTLWGHLEELLTRLRTMFYAVIASVLLVMIFPIDFDLGIFFGQNPQYTTIATFVINKIQEDFLPSNVELIPISYYAPVQVYMYVSLVLGVAVSSPVIAYELYRFVNPALYEYERRTFMSLVVLFVVLFVLGFSLGYILVMPATLRVLLFSAEALGLASQYGFEQFFSLAAGGLLISGFVMTFPIYIALLVRANVIETEQISKNRKYIYGAIIIAISILDPDPTLITEMFLGAPVILVLEATIRVLHRSEKSPESSS